MRLIYFMILLILTSCALKNGDDVIHCKGLIFQNKLIEFERILQNNPKCIRPSTNHEASLFKIAVDAKNTKAVEILIKKGALQIEYEYGNHPLWWAISSGDIDIFKIILNESDKKYINIRNDHLFQPSYPLHIALYRTPEFVDLLIKNGALLNVKDYNGNTALHEAVRTYDPPCNPSWGKDSKLCADLILDAAKDKKKLILEEDNNGYNVFQAACKYNNIDFVNDCIDQGIDVVNIANSKNGKTALHIACYNGFTRIVNLLLKNNASVKIKTIDGQTALHATCAWGYGNREIIEALIKQKIDLNVIDKTGKTALDYTLKHQEELSQFLRQNRAKSATELKSAPVE